jgi:hypothetical protein
VISLRGSFTKGKVNHFENGRFDVLSSWFRLTKEENADTSTIGKSEGSRGGNKRLFTEVSSLDNMMGLLL